MKCPDCGSENSDSANTCISCGRGIEWWRIKSKGKVGRLAPEILSSLDVIPKTYRGKVPAEAVLKDGRRFPCVLFLEVTDNTQNEYFPPVGLLGAEYEFDERTRRTAIQPDAISSIAESRHRTPTAIEKKMWQSEFRETYMGAPFLCKIILDDGTELLMERGTWETEFIVLPDDLPNTRIIDVAPIDYVRDFHRLQDAKKELPDPGVMYCLFRR